MIYDYSKYSWNPSQLKCHYQLEYPKDYEDGWISIFIVSNYLIRFVDLEGDKTNVEIWNLKEKKIRKNEII